MKSEHNTVSFFAEESSALLPNRLRGGNPGRGFQVELPKLLESAVERLRHQLDSHLVRLANGASSWRILLSLQKRRIVIAQAPATGRRFFRTVAEDKTSGFLIKTDCVRLSAAFLHALEDGKRFGIPVQAHLDILPRYVLVAHGIVKKPVFQHLNHQVVSFIGLPAVHTLVNGSLH